MEATGQELNATPAYGMDIDFSSLGGGFHMPGMGLLGEMMDMLSSPSQDAAPAKVEKHDHKPSYAVAAVPTMKM